MTRLISLQRLGDHIDLLGGGTPSKEVDDFWGGSIPWATVKDLKHDILENTVDRISQLGLDNSSSKLVRSGSILIATRMAVGRVVMAGVDVAINQDLKAITCDDNIDTKFLYYFLQSQNNYFNRMSSGATVKGIKVAHIMDLEIPLPPLAEQKKIAAILDAADQLRQKDQQLIDHYTALSQSLFLEMFGDPVTNPMGWEKMSIDAAIKADLISELQDGNHGEKHPKVSDFGVEGIPFIMANCFTDNELNILKAYKLAESWKDRLRIGFAQAGDVLLSHKGTVGEVAIVPSCLDLVILSPQVTYYRTSKLLNAQFLAGQFSNNVFQQRLRHEAKQSTRAYIGITRQKQLSIIIPELSVQKIYANQISKIKSQIKIAKLNLEKSNNLFESLLQKAFKGELTSRKAA